jgi:hypothetical protein
LSKKVEIKLFAPPIQDLVQKSHILLRAWALDQSKVSEKIKSNFSLGGRWNFASERFDSLKWEMLLIRIPNPVMIRSGSIESSATKCTLRLMERLSEFFDN